MLARIFALAMTLTLFFGGVFTNSATVSAQSLPQPKILVTAPKTIQVGKNLKVTVVVEAPQGYYVRVSLCTNLTSKCPPVSEITTKVTVTFTGKVTASDPKKIVAVVIVQLYNYDGFAVGPPIREVRFIDVK